MLGLLNKLVALVEKGERAACALTVVGFFLILTTNVGLRYLFNRPLYFAEELCVLIMVWMAFIGTSLLIGRREMIAVTILVDLFPERARKIFALVSEILVLFTVAVFFYWSATWVASPSAGREIILTLAVPKWPAFLIIPVFFALAALKTLRNILQIADSLRHRELVA